MRYRGFVLRTRRRRTIRFPDTEAHATLRALNARVPVAEYAGPVMYATDGETSRQVPPRGLGVCRGSAPVGQKELALPGQRRSSVATAPPRPRYRRIGQWWPQGACSPAAAIRAMA